ncbi:MAG: response regulator [Bacteroidetes bacterium]|nr:response regulator [Bacteroidota bacterium]
MKDRDPILQQYGAIVREIRRERHISQEELAHQSDLHRTYITDIERGARNVSLRNIIRIAGALHVPLSEFFGRFEAKLRSDGRLNGPVDILLVEDDESFIELTRHTLQQLNITNTLRVVRDGAEALRVLLPEGAESKPAAPSVVLLDLTLPMVGGLEVLQQLRKDPRTATLPVVVLTVSVNESDRLQCRRLGVEEYLTKPIDVEAFAAVMKRLGFQMKLVLSQDLPRP